MAVHCDQIAEGSYRIRYDDPENEDPFYGGEFGEAFPCHYDDQAEVRKCVGFAVLDAQKTLPRGTVFEIRAKCDPANCYLDFGRKVRTRDELARDYGVAWYALVSKASGFQERPLRDLQDDPKLVPDEPLVGCKILGRLKVG